MDVHHHGFTHKPQLVIKISLVISVYSSSSVSLHTSKHLTHALTHTHSHTHTHTHFLTSTNCSCVPHGWLLYLAIPESAWNSSDSFDPNLYDVCVCGLFSDVEHQLLIFTLQFTPVDDCPHIRLNAHTGTHTNTYTHTHTRKLCSSSLFCQSQWAPFRDDVSRCRQSESPSSSPAHLPQPTLLPPPAAEW